MPKKLKFLRNRVTALKGSAVLNRVHDLCERRNAILHTSFKYEEVKSLPTEPYVPGLHDHLPESAFAQRPRLSTRRSFPRPPLEQAQADYDTACEFLKLMYDTIPYEPWPPPRFNSRSPEFRRCDAVQVAHGSTFGIELIERSTAGYTWRLEQPVDGVELLESSLTPPPAGHVGASGTRHFRFRATKRGNYGLVFQLRREWEEDPVERRTVQIEVT
jgi:predicted secreted protein